MITLNDVDKITVGFPCREEYPCAGHTSTVTLKNGRSVSQLTTFEICSIVSHLAKERINPGGGWGPEDVKRHFGQYNLSYKNTVKSPEVVLNRIFS